jgi:DNA-binding response OmpR family regulator
MGLQTNCCCRIGDHRQTVVLEGLLIVGTKSSRSMKVMVVEDSATLAQLYRINLARHGFQSEWVTSVNEAIGRLNEPGIDIILLDLSLPDSHGIETFFRVHNQAEEVPIVVLSSFDDESTALQALKGGAQDYLIKGRATDEAVLDGARPD